MAETISKNLENLSQEALKRGQLILSIDGFDEVFGVSPVTRVWRIGDRGLKIGDENLSVGGVLEMPSSKAWIMKDGTTTKITQKIDQDKGSSTSIQTATVRLIDKESQLTKIFSPGNVVTDIRGTDCTLSVSFGGGDYPNDSLVLMHGTIDDISFGPGNTDLLISHPDQRKRTEIFNSVSTELTADIDQVATTIPVEITNGMIESQDSLEFYIRIDDEIIKVGSINGQNLEGCSRGQFGTIAVSHDNEEGVETIYRLTGNPIDLALKLMLSGDNNDPMNKFKADFLGFINEGQTLANSVFFSGIDIVTEMGITAGDLLKAEDSLGVVVAEDIVINLVEVNSLGSYIVTESEIASSTLENELLISIKSQFKKLPQGCSMKPKQVDIQSHLDIKTLLGAILLDLDFLEDEKINAKEFIESQLYAPFGLFSMPRKGRVGVKSNGAPIIESQVVTLDINNIENPTKLRIAQKTSRDYFNTVVYKFHRDRLNGKFLRQNVFISNDSIERIAKGIKAREIKCRGIRRGSGVVAVIDDIANRYLNRFKFGADSVKGVQVKYGTGFNIDIGDSVILDGESVNLSDPNFGDRNFAPRLMEVRNKVMGVLTGRITLDLLDTKIGLDGRFGVFAPSSQILNGSTVTSLKLGNIFNGEKGAEKKLWKHLIGQNVRVVNSDYTFDETVKLNGFDPVAADTMLIGSLTQVPGHDFVVIPPEYPDNSDSRELAIYKELYPFFNPQVEIESGVSSVKFIVSAGDIDKFALGAFVRIHNSDYTEDSGDLVIIAIELSTREIEVNKDIGFTPDEQNVIDLIGFKDGGLPYRFL